MELKFHAISRESENNVQYPLDPITDSLIKINSRSSLGCNDFLEPIIQIHSEYECESLNLLISAFHMEYLKVRKL